MCRYPYLCRETLHNLILCIVNLYLSFLYTARRLEAFKDLCCRLHLFSFYCHYCYFYNSDSLSMIMIILHITRIQISTAEERGLREGQRGTNENCLCTRSGEQEKITFVNTSDHSTRLRKQLHTIKKISSSFIPTQLRKRSFPRKNHHLG